MLKSWKAWIRNDPWEPQTHRTPHPKSQTPKPRTLSTVLQALKPLLYGPKPIRCYPAPQESTGQEAGKSAHAPTSMDTVQGFRVRSFSVWRNWRSTSRKHRLAWAACGKNRVAGSLFVPCLGLLISDEDLKTTRVSDATKT